MAPRTPSQLRLRSLEVDTERMRANLDATHGLIVAERVSFLLARALRSRRGARDRPSCRLPRCGNRSFLRRGASADARVEPSDES